MNSKKIQKSKKKVIVKFDEDEEEEVEEEKSIAESSESEVEIELPLPIVIPKKYINVTIGFPDSVIEISQSGELRAFYISQLSRLFCFNQVDEVVVYKDHGFQAKSPKFDATNYVLLNLQYLETPQYLRKHLFPISPDLKYAGLMAPVESRHHLKRDEICIYREGAVVNRPVKEGDETSWVDIGLPLQAKIDYRLDAGTRVTVKLEDPHATKKFYKASVVSSQEPKETGMYWGYTVRDVTGLGNLLFHEHYPTPAETLRICIDLQGQSYTKSKLSSLIASKPALKFPS